MVGKMSKKYLVAVDDEQDLKFLFDHFFAEQIENDVLSVEFLDSAKKCLDYLETIEGHIVVLTDINMPGMSGIELLKEINKLDSKIQVLLTSAYDETNYLNDMKKYNAAGYISKPVDFNSLRVKVLNLLNIQQ
ncbi:MAG: response regulator [Halobacteriovoraceae bacterium]|nr:response regulator [Halobacteriovoraceae bacterium]|tara:strand:- start:11369 stop:11767 length:399 start_codon:yes stop_codon:yes gene_type:complete